MTANRENMLRLLQGYREAQKKIEILLYEQKCAVKISAEEVIKGLALRPPQSSGLPGSKCPSDQTMWIATEYQEITRRLNEEHIYSVAAELAGLTLMCERLELYVALLSEERRKIIQLHYFEGKTWLQMQHQLNRAKRTLTETNAHAIDELAEMYAYVNVLKSGDETSSPKNLGVAAF